MKNSMLKSQKLFEAAQDPEYRFLLIEPILSYGIAIGIILFVVSFFLNHSKLQLISLIITGASAFAFMPYMAARRAAMPRIEQIYRFDASLRGKLFTDNTILWSASTWMYTALVILGIATIVVGCRRNQLGYGLSFATVLVGLLAVQNSLWLHYQDASAYHPNLRAHRAPIQTTVSNNASTTSKRIPAPHYPVEKNVTAPNTPKQRHLRNVRPIN